MESGKIVLVARPSLHGSVALLWLTPHEFLASFYPVNFICGVCKEPEAGQEAF